MLRITSETRCNIPENSQACAYCAWDWAKQMETGAPRFTLDTIDQLGDFYRAATHLGDCSIGEPTMHKQFGAIVARIGADGKRLSFTTNGQLLGERRRRELVGKDIDLYVSIDSATAEGYKRYRNDRFDDLARNLRELCREKRAHGDLPRVFASLIVMRSNLAELPAYFDLMKQVGVDQVKLRALYEDDNVAPRVMNNGHAFDYLAEMVPLEELAAMTPTLRRMAADRGVPLYVEWEEFEPDSVHGPREPICSEPWKTLYVLSRGVMPCCYATEPLGRWSEQGDRTLAEFLKDVFNSPEYQHIRQELAAGRLANYCWNTPSCPVMKRMRAAGAAAPPAITRKSIASQASTAPLGLPILAQGCSLGVRGSTGAGCDRS